MVEIDIIAYIRGGCGALKGGENLPRDREREEANLGGYRVCSDKMAIR